MNTIGPKCCALPLCNLVENLRICSRCRVTYYCGKDHQRRDWPSHRKVCYQTEKSTSPTTATATETSPDSVNKLSDVQDVSLVLSTMTDEGQERLQQEPSQIPSPAPNTFSTKRSHEQGDSSYVDLETLALTQSSESGSSASGSSIEQETSEFSDHILRSHSYPLTPHSDSQDSEEDDIEDNGNNKSGAGFWQVGATEPSMPSGPSCYPPGKVGLKQQPKEWLEKLTKYLVECMHKFGICVIDRVLGTEKGEAILKEVLALHNEDRFSEGQLVKANPAKKGAIRGDKIMWTDGLNPNCKNIRWLISQMDTIIQMTNGHFENINITSRTKAMVACYPGKGTCYVKHVDNPNQDGRCITCIYYLNKGWNSKTDGGLLRIYPRGKDSVANVEPLFDRILFFWSDMRNPHEVLPAFKTRYAITVWYFNPTERAKAKSTLASKQSSK